MLYKREKYKTCELRLFHNHWTCTTLQFLIFNYVRAIQDHTVIHAIPFKERVLCVEQTQ